MYKKMVATVLISVMALGSLGCSLFAGDSIVKFTDEYQHEDSSDMKGKERVALKCEGFDKMLEEMVNAEAYPDTSMTDEEGNIIGLYDYDAETGLAMGWTNTEDGTYTAFDPGEEVDLGVPDESMMLDIPGTVTIGMVIYGEEQENSEPSIVYVYAFLTDPEAAELVIENMEYVYDLSLSAKDDNTLLGYMDSAYIADRFEQWNVTDGKTVQMYAFMMQQLFGASEVEEETAVNLS